MEPLDMKRVREYVNDNISIFHQRRANSIEQLKLKRLLSKNPYLFRAKNVLTASEMIDGLLGAFRLHRRNSSLADSWKVWQYLWPKAPPAATNQQQKV